MLLKILPDRSITMRNMSENLLPIKGSDAKHIFLILLLTAITYLPLLGLPAWDGHEPIRVVVARYMLETGNWVLPLLHGKPYLLKPPMMNWLIAASGGIFGILNEWTSRIPSVFIMALTGVSIYSMTDRWLSREGRLFAAIATISMAGLIEKGRQADMDSLFILFVVLVLLTWINGYSRQWKPTVIWSISLLLLGIGFLAKGPQIIAYFYITIFAYLLLKKNLSFFFSKEHLLGILIFISIDAIYLSFVLRWMTFTEYINLWAGQIAERGESRYSYAFLKHFISFPIDALLSFLPWTLFAVPVLILKDLRMEAKAAYKNELLFFAFVMVAANFPLYWVLKSARFRYFLPAGPFIAMGIAALLDGYLNGIQTNKLLDALAKNFIRYLSWVALLSVLAAVPAVIFLKLGFSMPLVLLLTPLFLLALFVILKLDMLKLIDISVVTVLFTALFFLVYTLFTIQIGSEKENHPKKIAYQINSLLPDDIGPVYEIGYRQVLGTTCYLDREVIQLDNFSELDALYKRRGQIYFIFNSSFLSKTTANDRKFLQDHKWEKVYSSASKNGKNEVVLGQLQ
jgi:4-amino-4-deoxy-L-arabinose transferase-like glycosyltransferase